MSQVEAKPYHKKNTPAILFCILSLTETKPRYMSAPMTSIFHLLLLIFTQTMQKSRTVQELLFHNLHANLIISTAKQYLKFHIPFVRLEQMPFDIFEISRHCLLKCCYHFTVFVQKLSSTWSTGEIVHPRANQVVVNTL